MSILSNVVMTKNFNISETNNLCCILLRADRQIFYVFRNSRKNMYIKVKPARDIFFIKEDPTVGQKTIIVRHFPLNSLESCKKSIRFF